VADHDRHDDQREWLKLLFEHYKHFTTLSGAGALVILTIYREDVLSHGIAGKALWVTLILFALVVVISSFGMAGILDMFPHPGRGQWRRYPLLAHAAWMLFAVGVGLLLYVASGFSGLPLLIAIVVLILLLIVVLLVRRSRRRVREPE